ncbi:MAG: tetratricopeptide repeat protein [Planctomycetes bacterium]|nr:tetratricopeptide repeat protein [Planctomycetota bacterium]
MTEPTSALRTPPPWWVLYVILACTAAVYAPSLGNGFTYDDATFVKAETASGTNVMVAELHPIRDYFARPYGFGVEKTRGFRPAMVYGLALTHHLVGGDIAWPHHLVNILLHVLCTFLAFRVVALLGGPGLPALLAAAVFGLHAIRSDPVVSIVGRAELQGFAGGAAALLLVCGAVERRGVALAWRLTAAALAVLFGMLSKESAVVWVVFVPLYASLRANHGQRIRVPRLVAVLAAMAVPLAVYLLLRSAMLSEHAPVFQATSRANPIFAAAWDTRVPTATILLGYALWKVVVPYPLVCEYGVFVFRIATGLADPRFLAVLLVLVAILVAGLAAWRRAPLLFAAVATFLGFSFVTSNLAVPIETIFGERLLYTPAIGLSFAIAWVAARWTGTPPMRFLGLLIGGWLLVNGGLCLQRSFDWRTDDGLFLADAPKQPDSLFLNLQAGRIESRRGNRTAGERYFQRAIELAPRSSIPLVALARVHSEQGRIREAAECLQRALPLEDLTDADRALMRVDLGAFAQRLGQPDRAIGFLREALQHAPGFAEAHRARVGMLWLHYERNEDADLARVTDELDADLAARAGASERTTAAAHVRLFRGLIAFRKRDWAAAANLLGGALATLDKAESRVANIQAAPAYVESVHRSGQSTLARRIAAAYLGWQDLPAAQRSELERLRAALDR